MRIKGSLRDCVGGGVWVAVVVVAVCAVVLVRPVCGQTVCSHNVQHTQANCSNRGQTTVYWGLHINIEVLDLSHNKLTELTARAFKRYNNLTVLLLRNNSISTLHPQALTDLRHLRTLDLSMNHLASVPTPMLSQVPSLYTLSLASNNIMLVSDDSFSELSQLKTLDLSGNRISELEPQALFNLVKLQKLNMAFNSLRSLPNETFTLLSPELLDIRLHSNPWICDCKVRFLHQWMTEGNNGAIWQHPGEPVLCDGPSMSRGKPVSSIPRDELACRVEMMNSGSSQAVDQGGEAVLECIYFSIPTASPIWHKNDIPINAKRNPHKYNITAEGSPRTVTQLHVRDFQYSDIAAYECLAQNVRGSDSTEFKVTLTGVPFSSVKVKHEPSTSAGLDTKSMVVAVAVVCGIILIIVVSVLIYCFISHIRRRQQEKRDAVVENVKKHFMANGEMVPKDGEGGELDKSLKDSDDVDKAKLDQFDDTNSESTRTNDTNTTQPPKHALEGDYCSDKEPLYTFQQSHAPYAAGNTYVSFGSEMTEPESMQMYARPRANSTMRYDGSHTESSTPLLDPYTPSVYDDSQDPFDPALYPQYPQYPVYEAATLYYPKRNHFPEATPMPPLTPGSGRSNTRSTTFIPAARHDYHDYRDMRYPYNVSPDQFRLASKKSMSVGNLGGYPAPRKPPRVFHSREYVEMSPHDTSGASDYMSVPPDQAYYYGIKPGTPV